MKLHKVAVHRTRMITLRHEGSGAEKVVEYLGTSGIPLRAQIHWPVAGDYLVSPKSGTIVGSRKNAGKLRAWKVIERDRAFLREEWRLARARAALSAPSLMSART